MRLQMNSASGVSRLVALGVLWLLGCQRPGVESVPPAAERAAVVATDGAYTVNGVEQLNQWAVLAANAAAGGSSLRVTDITQLDSPLFGPIAPGDLVLVVQMQGATFNTTDTALFGEVSSLNSAGLHELIEVVGVDRPTNTLTVSTGCSGLKNAYSTAAATQVVRVPQLTSLTVSATGTVTAMPWNGARGGVVALHVRDTLSLLGTIDVSGLGFRGGQVDNLSVASAATDTAGYRAASGTSGAEKGESIGGSQATYDGLGGRYGRGAPANGGGGGNAFRAGGGGGANASNGNTWNGQGVMDPNAIGAAAWTLDPGRLLATSTASLANNSGGGRGGYSFSQVNLNATATGPGSAGWSGNLRRERGGLGGRPQAPSALSRLFLGGGGGAGDGDQAASGGGGAGGGLIYLVADTVSGSGALVANGQPGSDTVGSHRDGAGGGGSGGSVVVRANGLSGFSISANGGNGGRQLIDPGLDEATGPGGGGSGGFIATAGGAVTRSAVGGLNGDTRSNGVTEFPANGATRGAAGVSTAGVAVVVGTAVQDAPSCIEPAELSVTLTDTLASAVPGTSVTYTLVVSNAGPGVATRAHVVDTLPAALTGATWTCAATAGGTCTASGANSIDQFISLPAGGSATFTITATITSTATGVLTNQAVVYSPPIISDPLLTNNVAIDTDTLAPAGDVSVDLSAAPSPVNEHATVTWTMNVANAGPSQAAGLTLTFNLPTGVTWTSTTGAGWTCSRAGLVVTCTRLTLASGASSPVTVGAVVTQPGGTLATSASIVTTSVDTVSSNNSQNLTTPVNPVNDPPVNLVPANQTLLEDSTFTFSTLRGTPISVSDVDIGTGDYTVTLTASQGTLSLARVSGLTFTVGDGVNDATMGFSGPELAVNTALDGLTFTPPANAWGSATVTINTSDNGFTGLGGVLSDTDTIGLTITPVNDPPTAVADAFTVQEDSLSTFNVLGNDSSLPDGPEVLTIIAASPAAHGVVSGGGTNLQYRPNANYYGPDSFTYTITDGNGGNATATVSVTVMPVNDPPTALDDIFSVVEGSTANPLPVLNNDSSFPDGPEVLTVTAVTPPVHGLATIAPGGSQLLYTPTPGYNGTDSLTYTVTDPGGLWVIATVSVTVGPANDPPLNHLPADQTIDEDTSLTFSSTLSTSLSVSDPDAANAPIQLTFSATGGALTLGSKNNLTFTLGDGTDDATMSFTGTITDVNAALEAAVFRPAANFNGAAKVELNTNDLGNTGVGGALSDIDSVTITVRPVNDPPTGVDDVATMAEDATDERVDVLANDSISPDTGETLRVTAVGAPAHGTARLDQGGLAVRYTPNANYFGSDSFTYTMTDGNGGTASATVSVTVLPVNDPPQAAPDVFSVAQDSADDVLDVLANDTIAPDVNETLAVIVVSPAQHGTVTVGPGGADLRYTPTRGYIGPDTVTYTVRDSSGGYAATIVSITVGADSDSDGLSDGDELVLGTDPFTADSDHDLLPDGVEVKLAKTDPLDDDTDDDGLLDGNEDTNHNGALDSGETRPLEPDTDQDGLLDGQERGLAMPQGHQTKLTVFRPDRDPTTQTNPLRADTDNGGVKDGAEDENRNGAIDPGETDPNNGSDDRVDTDRDGLTDLNEVQVGLNPMDADCDDDGVLDGADGLADSDRDGLIDALDPDSDNDGVKDGTEKGVTSELKPADTDATRGSFVPDLDPTTTTDSTRADSDGDGLADGAEDRNHDGRKDEGETDASKADTDGDGLDDGLELRAANPTNPELADTDGDGLSDGAEDANHNGRLDEAETDPNLADSDHGGALDGAEVSRATDPLNPNDDFVVRGGGGCSLGDAGAWWLMALLLLVPRRRTWGLVALVLVLPLAARAQTTAKTAIDVQRFKSGAGSQDFLNVESASVAEAMRGFIDLHVGYADNPLILGVPGSSTTALRVVDDLTWFDLTGGFAFKDHAEVFVGLPMSIAKGQQSALLDPSLGQNPLGFAVGDLRLGGKYAFFERASPFNVAAELLLAFPTGNTNTFRGGGAVVFSPRVLAELNLGVLRLAANAGVTLRTAPTRLLDLTVGQEFIWAAGADIPVYGDSNALSVLLTTTGAVGLSGSSSASVPIDALGGLRYRVKDFLAVEVAIGGGITRGWATPRFEAVVGVSFFAKPIPLPSSLVELPKAAPTAGPEPEAVMASSTEAEPGSPAHQATPRATVKDADHDGVPDELDRCPQAKETVNGVDDDDGCPDEGEGLVSIASGTLKLKTRLGFNRGAATFTRGSESLIAQLALTLKSRPTLRLRFEVYVTELGTRPENERLASARARAIADALETRGVDVASQVETRALGMQRPFDASTVDISAF